MNLIKSVIPNNFNGDNPLGGRWSHVKTFDSQGILGFSKSTEAILAGPDFYCFDFVGAADRLRPDLSRGTFYLHLVLKKNQWKFWERITKMKGL